MIAESLCLLLFLVMTCVLNMSVIYFLLLISFFYFFPKKLIRFIQYLIHKKYPDTILFCGKQTEIANALTIDDVPNPSSFSRTFESLQQYNLSATFFIISDYVFKSPRNRELLISAVKSKKFHLANHGKTNSVHAFLSEKELENELDHCETTISEMYKEADVPQPQQKYYRPGCGLVTPSMIRVCQRKNYKIVLGSVYGHGSLFYYFPLWNFFYTIIKMGTNDIIILHDRMYTNKTLQYFAHFCTSEKKVITTLDHLV